MQKSQRLVQMMMKVNAKKSFTAQELADEFGLSVRTITRDLRELSELGVPIYSVQGRGGGYRLLQERVLPPISFTESEAIALFFACQSLQYFGALPFDEGATSALDKFYHYLPADTRKQIDLLQYKAAIWNPHRYMKNEHLQTLLEAMMKRRIVTIQYKSRHGETTRDIQPIGLFASTGYWYCPAYCFVRESFRLFRADRIISAQWSDTASWREEYDHDHLWNNPLEPSSTETVVLEVKLTSRGVHALESDQRFRSAIVRKQDGSGTANLPVFAENLTFYADWMWQLGEDAIVVNPPQAVEYLRKKSATMHSIYGEPVSR